MKTATTTSKATKTASKDGSGEDTASRMIDAKIKRLGDWRGKTLVAVRKAILSADKEIVEEWKWMGSPVWECNGIIAVGNAHKDKVKLTFDYGAKIPDPDKLFNAGLEGNQRRAIDFLEGDKVNAATLKNLVRAAIAFNRAKKKVPGNAAKTVTRVKANKKQA